MGKSNSDNDLTMSRIKHTREIIKQYNDLQKYFSQYNTSVCDYVKHLLNMVIQFEDILELEKNNVSGIVINIEQSINESMSNFKLKFDELFRNLDKILKSLSNFMKEREFVQLDYNFYSSEFKKLQNGNNNLKKKIDVENKLNESIKKCKYLDDMLDVDLPNFLNLNNALVKSISTLLFFNSLEIFGLINTHFSILQKSHPDIVFNNLYFDNESRKVMNIHKDLNNRIESLEIMNYSTRSNNLYNMNSSSNTNINKNVNVQHEKTGTALYTYKSDNLGDLSFKKGDIVHVVKEDPSGWWTGFMTVNGSIQTGKFPYNYFTF